MVVGRAGRDVHVDNAVRVGNDVGARRDERRVATGVHRRAGRVLAAAKEKHFAVVGRAHPRGHEAERVGTPWLESPHVKGDVRAVGHRRIAVIDLKVQAAAARARGLEFKGVPGKSGRGVRVSRPTAIRRAQSERMNRPQREGGRCSVGSEVRPQFPVPCVQDA